MTKRYIDVDKLIAEYDKVHIGPPGGARKLMVDAPTADVVEVVRCKDCKHATFYSCKNDSCYKGIICEYRIGTDDENFYCSYGERRTDDGKVY